MKRSKDLFKRGVKVRLLKYIEDITPFEARGEEALFHRLFKPYQVVEIGENCALNTGINEIWNLITGGVSGAGHIYDHDHAQIGVGDSSTPADPTDTDLKAAENKTYKGMQTDYPTYGTGQKATFKASFGPSDANYPWNEWVVKQSTSGICLNRKVAALGTKATGTWTLEVQVSMS